MGISIYLFLIGRIWAEGPLLREERMLHCMSELYKNKVLITGGVTGTGSYIKSTYILDLMTGTFSDVGDLSRNRRMPDCILFKNRLYLVEERKRHYSETEMFDPDRKTWTKGPSFPRQIDGRPTLAKIQNQLFCSDFIHLYKLFHHESNTKWELITPVKGQKSSENFIPLAVVILEVNPIKDNICNFFMNK